MSSICILGCIMDEKDSIEENWDLKSIVEDFFEMLNDALAMGNKFEENGEGWTLMKLVKCKCPRVLQVIKDVYFLNSLHVKRRI